MNRARKTTVTLADFKRFDKRAARGLEVARALDRCEPLPHSALVHILRFDDFLRVLTPKRFELLHLARTGKRTIAELAAVVQRTPSAVARDIGKLRQLGLVDVNDESAPADGKRKVVRPAADKIEIQRSNR